MPDKQDQKKKEDERKDKKTHAMHEHEAEIHHESHAHNPAGDVQVVTANHANHEHGLQNKEVNKEKREEVNIHSDDKNQRHTHVPKAEQLAHDVKAEESKKDWNERYLERTWIQEAMIPEGAIKPWREALSLPLPLVS